MRKAFLFLAVAGSCLGITGCVGSLGALLPSLLSDVAFSAIGALISSLIAGAFPTAS